MKTIPEVLKEKKIAKKKAAKFFAFFVFPIVYFLFMFFYCVYSGIMMVQLKQPGMVARRCYNTLRKYQIMAKLCFSTSLIMLVMGIITAPYFVRRKLGKNSDHDDCRCSSIWCPYYCTLFINIPAVCAFIANFILIPLTIFEKHERHCEKNDMRQY